MTQFNDVASPAALLATRRSGKARDLQAPGPTPAQLHEILQSAMRVPDHGKLAPWRFVVIADDSRKQLGDALASILAAEKPDARPAEIEAARSFAAQAASLVVVLSKPSFERPIPIWEQELSAGAVTMNLCVAVHAQGFVANWLTGWATYSPGVLTLLGEPDERIAGFIFIGTPARPLEERPRPDFDTVVSHWPG